jgi:hypothetical protein
MYRNKPVTRQNLANSLNIDVKYVEQIDSKQLFRVRRALRIELYSYYTLVGHTDNNGGWLLTTTKYSPTTSKQLSQYASRLRQSGINVTYQEV